MAQTDAPGYIAVLLELDDFLGNNTEAQNRIWRFGLRLATGAEVTSGNCIKYVAHGAGSGGAWIYTLGSAVMTADSDTLTAIEMTSPSGGLTGVRALTLKYKTDGISNESGWENFAEGDLAPAVAIPEGFILRITSLTLTIKTGDVHG